MNSEPTKPVPSNEAAHQPSSGSNEPIILHTKHGRVFRRRIIRVAGKKYALPWMRKLDPQASTLAQRAYMDRILESIASEHHAQQSQQPSGHPVQAVATSTPVSDGKTVADRQVVSSFPGSPTLDPVALSGRKTAGRLPYFIGIMPSTLHYPSFKMIEDLLVERGWGTCHWSDPECNLLITLRLQFDFNMLRALPLKSGHPRLVNYFQGYQELTKLGMMWNFRQYVKAHPERHADVMSIAPATFWLSSAPHPKDSPLAQLQADERKAFLQYFDDLAKNEPHLRNIWILKPGYGLKGTGIKIYNDARRALRFVDAFGMDSKPETCEWVVQKYVERPLLLGGRKFDMRVFALLGPDFKLYMYDDGILRMSSVPFNLNSLRDPFVHLTNHCIQKKHDNYGAHEAGNEIFFTQFDTFLQQHYPDRSLRRDVIPAIERVMINSLETVQRFMVKDESFLTYQMLGYDIMLTEDFNGVLLEVNSTPGCADDFRRPMYIDWIDLIISPLYPNTSKVPATTSAPAAFTLDTPAVSAAPPAASSDSPSTAAAPTTSATAGALGSRPVNKWRMIHDFGSGQPLQPQAAC